MKKVTKKAEKHGIQGKADSGKVRKRQVSQDDSFVAGLRSQVSGGIQEEGEGGGKGGGGGGGISQI